MTTSYRCAACGVAVEVEVAEELDRVEVTPCEVCVGVAEEAVREVSYDKGYQEGWQAGYDTMTEEEEDTASGDAIEKEVNQSYRDGYEAGRKVGWDEHINRHSDMGR